ncbi:unnamed protein product [Lepeophtheirus salmonis]|uniref:(salmon louse) hypothetical protein n=1 Tax=Lepeophtheirus salmonis TaxID=72036 RepID=A0A7R8HDF3_LEPSM|nr:unnamed protein product [Lepeophtheirus salmonis]CAF3028683.1 unnamed protein product [Lepeophtheirus salmonis]
MKISAVRTVPNRRIVSKDIKIFNTTASTTHWTMICGTLFGEGKKCGGVRVRRGVKVMSTLQEQESLKHMILTFRVSELQMLLGFAGRNKNGKKHELQGRALELVKIRSSPMQAKIRELYKASQAQQAASIASMMSQSGQGHSLYSMGLWQYERRCRCCRRCYDGVLRLNILIPQQPNLYHFKQQAQQQAVQQQQQMYGSHYGVQQAQQQQAQQIKLCCSSSARCQARNNRHQEAQFQFFMTPSQATDIASHRDIRISSKLDYLYQIQLRFCPLSLDSSKEMADEFPPGIILQVNGKGVVLPNPIPTNRTGVEPKRPPKPVNITSCCKLSPILPNVVNIKWAGEYGKWWVVGIWLVMKCTSEDLLERLKKKGTRNSEYTKKTIIAKMCDDDDVETECLRVSVACPLGKMRMTLPCRPSTCGHLQCFDASLFLQMNERKTHDLPKDENDIILNGDGSWMPVPKEEESAKTSTSKEKKNTSNSDETVNGGPSNGNSTSTPSTNDDESAAAQPPLPPPSSNGQYFGAAPVLPPLPTSDPAPPPPPPPEIECIDLE